VTLTATKLSLLVTDLDPESVYSPNDLLKNAEGVHEIAGTQGVFTLGDTRYFEGRYVVLQFSGANAELAAAEIDIVITEKGEFGKAHPCTYIYYYSSFL